MENKLTLREIAPYLPYKLGCYLQGHKDEDDRPIKETILGLYDETEVFVSLNDFDYETYIISDVFPILRPLSDLTKEIEVNGEKFIPIISLSRLVDNGHNHSDSTYRKSSNYITVFTDKCDDVETVRFRFTIEGFSAIERGGEVIQFTTYDSIKNKLFEWHFDIFELIGQGLAVNFNTLST